MIRQIDEHSVDGMDQYAQVLQQKGAIADLGRLAQDLLALDDKRPEPWAALSLYHMAHQDTDKALAFIDKAIAVDQRHAFSHLVRGMILLAQQRPTHAIVSFFRANEISHDVSSYEGLVEAYLAAEKYKEAVCTAKEALSAAPRDPRAITLVGLALAKAPSNSQSAEGRERAKKALRKALAIDHSSIRALMVLVDLCEADGDTSACIRLLNNAIEGTAVSGSPPSMDGGQGQLGRLQWDRLYTRLAEVHAHCSPPNYSEALSCYHKALSMNHASADAQHGLEKLERIMGGSKEGDSQEMQEGDSQESYQETEAY